MRKKHQAVLISSVAKKNFCNEISLGNFTYDSEVKEQLRNFFNENIKQEDVENQDENNENSNDNDNSNHNQIIPNGLNNSQYKLSNINSTNNSKEYVKFQISEKAVLGNIDPFNYDTMAQKSLNICYDNSQSSEDYNKDLGENIKFFDIFLYRINTLNFETETNHFYPSKLNEERKEKRGLFRGVFFPLRRRAVRPVYAYRSL